MAFLRHATAALVAGIALSTACLPPAHAQEAVLNLYSARHYQTDEALYSDFTKATGIKINRIEAGDEQLVERLRSEGAASPADLLLIVDAARLWQAQQLGLFQPVKSAVLDERIPAKYRDPGRQLVRLLLPCAASSPTTRRWWSAGDVLTYEVAGQSEANKGKKACTRSGSPSVQPVADRLRDRAPGAAQGRSVGQRRGRQLRARAQGRRHRPDPRLWRPASARSR